MCDKTDSTTAPSNMTDYNALKVPDLKKLLQTRSLPVSGNKAELVARLQEDDHNNKSASAQDQTEDQAAPAANKAEALVGDARSKTSASEAKNNSSPATAGIAPPGDDEIDWGDDEPANATAGAGVGVSRPAADALAAAGGLGAAPNPTAVPNQKRDFDPSKTSDLTVKYPAPVKASDSTHAKTAVAADASPAHGQDTGATEASATAFTAGLGTTDLDAEIAKRKARAKRFQTGNAAGDESNKSGEEAIKALERAKRFGTAAAATTTTAANEGGAAGANGSTGEASNTAGVRGLDQALPERASRKRGRDRDADDARSGGGPGKRRRGGGGGGGGRGRDGGRGNARDDGAGARDRRGGNGRDSRTRNTRRREGGGNGGGGGGGGGGEGTTRTTRSGRGRITDDPTERAKAEARAKKFATNIDKSTAATAAA